MLSQYFRLQALIRNPLVWVIVLWATEVWLIQSVTLQYDYTAPMLRRIISGVWRMVLNIAGIGAIVLLLPRVLVSLIGIAWVVFGRASLIYHDFFHRAFSWPTISAQFTEGVQGASFDPTYVLHPVMGALLVALMIKLYWLWARPREVAGSRRLGIIALMIYMVVATVGVTVVDPLSKLQGFGTAERMGATHGYMLTWLGEHYYLDQRTLTKEAVARAQIKDTSVLDMLGPLAVDEVENIVIVQFESLDWRALGHVINHQSLVPFMKARLTDSIIFRTNAVHKNGSADADFLWLTGHLPSERVITYKLHQYPYRNTLGDKASNAGFHSIFTHGNSGVFFDRRTAIETMRLDTLAFSEDLYDLGLQESIWGIDDDDLFDYWANQLQQESLQLLYIVTLTSHHPFTYLQPSKQTLPIAMDSIENRYFASIHFTDEALASFYDQLPDNTLLIVFGDHKSIAEYNPADPNFAISGEVVPCIVHLKGQNLQSQMQVQPIIQASSMHAIAEWFHQWLANYQPEPKV